MGDDVLRSYKVDIGGAEMAYHVAGSGPVCLVHPGGPGFHYEYLRTPELEQHLTMVYIEPIGTGRSDLRPDGNYSMANYATDVARLIEHLDVGNVFFMGHSHGGGVGIQLALDHPDNLAGLISYAGLAQWDAETDADSDQKTYEYVAANGALGAQVLRGSKEVEAAGANVTKEEFLASMGRLLPVYFKDYLKIKDSLVDWEKTLDVTIDPQRHGHFPWNASDRLGEVTVPTLVLVGRADFICGEKYGRQIAENIPGAELVMFESSGHFLHLEEPAHFQKTVTGFIADHWRP